ncbi:MAG: hypothetical protein JJU29_16050 [Verrucomicrobia bacterium]|nr:hypothetical protein [Verrucomicrobiota bacterium]MCH8512934.1 hypothetical protein [Kiritimatiellia bacterium]
MPSTLTPSTLQVPKHRFSEPRHNLPGQNGQDTAEDRFTIAFARAYARQFPRIHRGTTANRISMVREIPVNGYGITDLLTIAWAGDETETYPDTHRFLENTRPTVRAFEMKLRDWRRAMSQASRYKNFAHQAIAVIPVRLAPSALPYLDTFRKIRTGLWLFDEETQIIRVLHTPRARKPRSTRYFQEAVLKASHVANPVNIIS